VQLFSLPNQAPAAAGHLIQAQQRVHYANKLDIASFQVKWVNGVLGAHSLWLRFSLKNLSNFSTGKNDGQCARLINLANRQMEILATLNFIANFYTHDMILQVI
jgi:hypothetical protein